MKFSSLQFRVLSVAILCSIVPALHAQTTTATTDPVGFVTVALAADSDSYTFIPFKRTPAFAGAASGAIGSVNTNEIPVTGASFTAGQFVYVSGTQSNHYYVFLKSGTKAGSYYTVTGNTTSGVTIDPNGDVLTAAIVNGTTFQIIPYDTLNTIFPGGVGVDASASHNAGLRKTEILLPDNQTAGTDLASSVSYYYYSGVSAPGAGWRKGGFTGTLANDDIFIPDSFFIVRHKSTSAGTSLTYMGTVQMAALSTPVGTVNAVTNQDNAIALPIAANLTLAQSKIYESGAFVGSSSHNAGLRKDELLVWDNAVVGHDKGSNYSYYYFTGVTGNGPGWRRAGDTSTLRDNEVVISGTLGLMLRKKSTGAVSSVLWSVTPSYVTAP